jgi:hypothetical protein
MRLTIAAVADISLISCLRGYCEFLYECIVYYVWLLHRNLTSESGDLGGLKGVLVAGMRTHGQ